jgi:hypothetical protein
MKSTIRSTGRRRFAGWFWAAALTVAPVFAQSIPQQPGEGEVQGYTAYVGGLLGLNFNEAQKAEIRRQVQGYWAARDRQSMKTVMDSRDGWQKMQAQPADLRAVALRMTRPDVLLGLQKAAREGRADSRYLLEAYYQANPVLAEGKPNGLPLTRDMVEAQLGIQHWMATEIHRQAAPAPDAKVVDAAVRAAAKAHASLTAEQQVQLARQPGELARIRYAWPKASPIDKLIARSDLGAKLTPQEQAAVQQVIQGFQAQMNGMVTQHRNAMLGGALQSMRENTDTIMGRGTVWNPATNRWEQQGGIVTEYNGVVRVP